MRDFVQHLDHPEAYLVLPLNRERLRERLDMIAVDRTLEEGDGQALADEIIDELIAALRKIFPDKSRTDFELVLGDLRAKTAEKLGQFTDCLVDAGDIVRGIVDELIDQATGDDHAPPTPAARSARARSRA
jgi:hypothetical protein